LVGERGGGRGIVQKRAGMIYASAAGGMALEHWWEGVFLLGNYCWKKIDTVQGRTKVNL